MAEAYVTVIYHDIEPRQRRATSYTDVGNLSLGSMGRRGFVEPSGGGCRIWIDASPGAQETAVEGVNEWRKALQVRIGAQPREGEANEELVRFLSERLGVPRKDVVIVRGARSGTKLVEVPLSPEEAARRLGV